MIVTETHGKIYRHDEAGLAELKNTANESGYLDISGTGNAPISTWSAQAVADKDYLLNTLNGQVIYNS